MKGHCSDEIIGEVNIARYFNRLIELKDSKVLRYESVDPSFSTKIDNILDVIYKKSGKTNSDFTKLLENAFLNIKCGFDNTIIQIITESLKKGNKT